MQVTCVQNPKVDSWAARLDPKRHWTGFSLGIVAAACAPSFEGLGGGTGPGPLVTGFPSMEPPLFTGKGYATWSIPLSMKLSASGGCKVLVLSSTVEFSSC